MLKRASWRTHALALLMYALCALFISFPLVTRLGDAFIANEFGQVDGFLSIWNLWWTAQATLTAQNPFHTALLFYPQGLDLFWLWLSLPNGLLALPATLLFGPLIAYNLSILAGYVLGAYAAFLFIRRYCDDDLAAFLGGACYAFTAFHMRRVLDAVMDTASIQWVPIYLLALHSLLERPRWWLALLCGFLVLVVGLGSWYYGLFCLLYTGVASLVWAVGGRGVGSRGVGRHQTPDTRHQTGDQEHGSGGSDRRSQQHSTPSTQYPINHSTFNIQHSAFNMRRFLWGLAPILVWVLLVAPQLLDLMQHGDQKLGVGLHANTSNSADLMAFVLPNPFHPLWGAAVSRWYTQLHPDAWLWQVSLGWVALGLALLAIWKRGHMLWRWLVLLLFTLLLAMGERLMVFGYDTGIPLPYTLIGGLPGIRTSHRPNHIVIMSALLLALLAAQGAALLLRRSARMRIVRTAGLLAALLLIDAWAGPLPLYSLPIPSAYAHLPTPDGGALLPVPLNLNVARSEQLWYQTAHGWPIIGGYTGREPFYPLGKYAPGIRELRYGRYEAQDIVRPGWPEDQRAMLAALNIRYVVFHPQLMKASLEKQRHLISAMGLSPNLRSPDLEVYPVPAQPLRMVAFLGEGWGRLEQDGERRWRWLSNKPAELYIYNPYNQPMPVSITFTAEAYGQDRPLQVSLDQTKAFELDITRAEIRRSLRFVLRPGTHVVYFSAPADTETNKSIVILNIEL